MSRIPKGATVPEFVFEEASNQAGHAWRPIASSLDQRAALELMDACPTSFPRRVVQVVGVRLPDGQRAQRQEVAAEISRLRAIVADHIAAAHHKPGCTGAPCKCGLVQLLVASRVFLEQTGGQLESCADPEYAGDRYAEDFPRPRGVTA